MTLNSSLPLTQVLVFDGFDDLDAIAPLEVLTAAGFATRVVRPAGHPQTVHSAHPLARKPRRTIFWEPLPLDGFAVTTILLSACVFALLSLSGPVALACAGTTNAICLTALAWI